MLRQDIIANLHESNFKIPSKVQDLTISHRDTVKDVQDRVSVFICNQWGENNKEPFIFLPVFQVVLRRNGELRKVQLLFGKSVHIFDCF